MKAPRFFIGSMLLFWGWQYQMLLAGVCLGLLLESVTFFKLRYDFKAADFNKFVDVSIVLVAGTVVFALSSDAENAMYVLVKWFPVVFSPVMGAQQISTAGEIDIQAFFLVGRKRLNMQTAELKKVDVSYPYSLACLLSAGMTKTHPGFFYIGAVLFFLWALWKARPGRYKKALWAVCLILVVVAGYFGHTAIRQIRTQISHWLMAYYMDYYSTDPFKSASAIGDIGELKLSDRIVLRVLPVDETFSSPFLLQSATYTTYAGSNWYSSAGFESVEPRQENTWWQIQPSVKDSRQMVIYSRQFKNKAVLSLPQGVSAIGEMNVEICRKNRFQAVRVEGGPSLVKSLAHYTGRLDYDPPPEKRDLMVSRKEAPGIDSLIKELVLEGKSDKEVLRSLRQFFASRFSYSLDLKGKGNSATPLQNFLNHTRAGHCELFATATALMLRQAGIPARYVTGFIVHEYSRLESSLVVRQRDAHAWVKVFIDGRWENLDTTPPSSLAVDSALSDPSLLADFTSFLRFKLSVLRHETGAALMKQYGMWLVLPLGLILFFRLRKKGSIKKVAAINGSAKRSGSRPEHVVFYKIETELSRKGHPRYPYETYCAWLDRIAFRFEEAGVKDRFSEIIIYYNRWRFSRSGLEKDEFEQFNTAADFILEKIKTLS